MPGGRPDFAAASFRCMPYSRTSWRFEQFDRLVSVFYFGYVSEVNRVISIHTMYHQAQVATLPRLVPRTFLLVLGVVLGTMLGHSSLAAEIATRRGAELSTTALDNQVERSSENPLWEIGGFALAVSQQAYPGSDQQVDRVLPLPFVVYRGKFLRVDRETTGLRAIRTPRYELDIGASGSFAARSSEIEARRGMPELGTLIEFGPRLRVNLGDASGSGRWRLDLPLRGVFDLSDGGAHRGIAFEPRLLWQQRLSPQFAYTASIGAIVGDKKLGHTFYGVDKAYANDNRPAFTAEGGIIAWRLSTSINYSLTPQWRVFGFGRVDSLSGAANQDSPLVRQTTGLSAGVGVFYAWLRSTRAAED